MGGSGADFGRWKHLKSKTRMIMQPTRTEIAMTMMRVLLSLRAVAPSSEKKGVVAESSDPLGGSRDTTARS